MGKTWQDSMRERITEVPPGTGKEMASRIRSRSILPFAAPLHWLELAGEPWADCARDARGVPFDPLLAQALPSDAERVVLSFESPDPLGEKRHSPRPRIVHQYPSRLLVRATGECALYCRHCFRRSLLPGERGFLSDGEQASAGDYLAEHPEIREVLVSGGDPLTASDGKLASFFEVLRKGRPGVLLRICTRMPVTLPERIDEGLLALFARYRPLRVVIQANHPRELSEQVLEGFRKIVASGTPMRAQTVLLRGINDSADTLEALFSALSAEGVDPVYLFQGDLAAGTSHFRVPLSRSLSIYNELRTRLSGMELPRLAVDAPGGGGKMYLPESIAGREGNLWRLKGPDGRMHSYPEEA
jgi:lysine 2,3-aminomutase